MKSQIVAVSLFGAVGTVSAGHYAAMDVDTWCLTYVSTYLVPVSVPVGSLLPTTRKLDALATGGSLKPGASTQTTAGTDTASTSVNSLIVPESLQTSLLSSIGSESSSLGIEPTQEQPESSDTTIPTLTDDPTTSLDSTTSTDLTPTSTSGIGIDEPAGRIVIFQIVVPDNEKRNLDKRATNGFVGNDNPGVCTFATTFNLAEGQLFDGGVPIFYSGEDFKELSGQGSPSSDAITATFQESGQRLVFRNSGLPNGEASFCQNSNGLIYIVFTAGPSSCIPVNLAVYNVEQCQNGRLVGVDELASTTGITNSEATITSSVTVIATSTEGAVIAQSSESTGASEVTTSTEPSSESVGRSTTMAQAESVESSSDTASVKASTTVSSGAVDSSTSLSLVVTTQPVLETSSTGVPALSETLDEISTEGEPVSSNITSEPVSEISATEVSTSSEESSSIEPTESASSASTSIEPEDSTTKSLSPQTSGTTSEVLADTTTSATTASTEAGTTVTAPALDQTSSTDNAGIDDTTTANAKVPTTTEGDTIVQETTTAAVEVPTTEPTEAGTTVNAPAPDETTSVGPAKRVLQH